MTRDEILDLVAPPKEDLNKVTNVRLLSYRFVVPTAARAHTDTRGTFRFPLIPLFPTSCCVCVCVCVCAYGWVV